VTIILSHRKQNVQKPIYFKRKRVYVDIYIDH